MVYCQNCGRKSHCGVPYQEELCGGILRICKQCRCDQCSKTVASFAPYDQSNWDGGLCGM